MKAELTIEIPDELIHLIIKEFEMANNGNVKLDSKIEQRKEAIVDQIATRLKLHLSKELQRKFKTMIQKANP